jgi:hypothetical protein
MSEEKCVTYKKNEEGNFVLLLGDCSVVAEVLLEDEEQVIEIVEEINEFIDSQEENVVVEVKNDDDLLGVIVDIFDEDQDDIIDTLCFWFDDFYEEEEIE